LECSSKALVRTSSDAQQFDTEQGAIAIAPSFLQTYE